MRIEQMESREATNQLLKKRWDLHKSPEVEKAARRTEARTGKKVPQDPLVRIQNYLDRLNEAISDTDAEGHSRLHRKEGTLSFLKSGLHDRFVIKSDEIPESHWENLKALFRKLRGGRDLGRADWKNIKLNMSELIIDTQKSSLDEWVDYFVSPDSSAIPNAIKYFALRSVLNMSEYDKERKIFPQRSKSTVKPFPTLNREALAYVANAIDKKYKGQNIDLSTLDEKDSQEFEKILQNENFPKLYAWAIEKAPEPLTAVKGKWKKFDQGSDWKPLAESLIGHNTGWCLVQPQYAKTFVAWGDIYIYYSLDQEGRPTIPRAVISMIKNEIFELRGVDRNKRVDSGVESIVEEKLKELPGGSLYKKRMADLRCITEIENKIKRGKDLTAQDLVFLYERDSPIEMTAEDRGIEDSSQPNRDPRIANIRSQRNKDEDMPIVFGCDSSQIARNTSDIKLDTKAYVGPLDPGIFNRLPDHIQYIYTSFPEERIRRQTINVGGKSAIELQRELEERRIDVSSRTKDMINSDDFITLKKQEELHIVRLKARSLGFVKNATLDQIYKKAKDLGLELCPAETGPHMRLSYSDQPLDESTYIGMKPITGSYVFKLMHDVAIGGLGLHDDFDYSRASSEPDDEFVFALPK